MRYALTLEQPGMDTLISWVGRERQYLLNDLGKYNGARYICTYMCVLRRYVGTAIHTKFGKVTCYTYTLILRFILSDSLSHLPHRRLVLFYWVL